MATNPLRPIVDAWMGVIHRALDYKKKVFQNDADEAMRFFNGPYDFIYRSSKTGGPSSFAVGSNQSGLSFQMTHNRVAEMVQLFGPVLYHQNPQRQVRPRELPEIKADLLGDPSDPMVQAVYLEMIGQIDRTRSADELRAKILETYLNYTPNELDLKTQARMAIDEAIIKGLGTLWSELYRRPGSQTTVVGSFYDTVDNLLLDPDMETIDEAKWCARRCVKPFWEVEREYGYPPQSLKQYANLESAQHQAASMASDRSSDFGRKQGHTNDLLVYWKIYSKMGMGGRIQGHGLVSQYLDSISRELEQFGDHVHIAIAQNVPFPLNLPDQLLSSLPPDQIFLRAQWPIPFWADGRWPFTPILFHNVPRQVWPMSHLKPGLGELCFLNWAYSFLAGKVKTTSKDYIGCLKSASAELKQTIEDGADLTIIEIEQSQGMDINKIVQFLQYPQINSSFFDVIGMVSDSFDKRVGLSELLYGIQPKQLRTAAAAQGQYTSIRIRPDDMAAKVDAAMSQVCRAEAIAARWYITPQDVAPVLGPIGAQMWESLIQSADMASVVQELEYSVEAGSARRKWIDETNTMAAINNLGPMLVQLGQATGDFTMVYTLMGDWAKANGLDPQRYLPPPREPLPPTPEQQAAQAEQQAAQDGQAQDMAQKEEKHQQGLQHTQEDHVAKLAVMIEQARVKNQLAKQTASKTNGRK